MTHLYRTLVVEDEGLARSRLARLVREHGQLELVRACENSSEALECAAEELLEIALLDIEMPGLDGLSLANRLIDREAAVPMLIFVTAHAQFAVEAFGVHAVDYLMKPFAQDHFDRAIRTTIARIEGERAVRQREQIRSLVNEDRIHDGSGSDESRSVGRVVVRENGKLRLVRAEQIDWFEAEGRSCLLHCGSKAHRVPGPLAHVLKKLGAHSFVQVSRSSFLNVERIGELQEMFKGTLTAVLKNGDEVQISRRYRSMLMQCLAGE
jgi:two-component system LytT family response regulator